MKKSLGFLGWSPGYELMWEDYFDDVAHKLPVSKSKTEFLPVDLCLFDHRDSQAWMSSRRSLVVGGKTQQLYLQKLSREIKEYTVAIQQRPDDEVAYYNRGVCFFELRRFSQAVLDFTKSVSIRPSYEVAYFNRAVCYGKMKKYALAINDFTRVISFNPKFDMAFYNRGFYFEEWKHYEKAIQDYSRAIAINPKLSKAYVRRGLCYEEFGHQFDMAIENYTQAIMINKKDSFAHFNRGLCYFHIYQFQSAINDYTRAIHLKPDDDKAFYNRGECFKKMNRLEESISDFSRYITLSPTSGEGYFKRGDCFKSLGQLEKAIADFTVATKKRTNFEAAFNQRGLCYQALGRPNEAFQDFSQAVKLNPFFANAWLNRGKLRWRVFVEYEKAIDDLERALVSNPKLRNAQTALRRVCKEILSIGKEKKFPKNRLSIGFGDDDEEEEESEGEMKEEEIERKKRRDGLLDRPEELSNLRGLAFLKRGMVAESIWSFSSCNNTNIGYRNRKECRRMFGNLQSSIISFKKEVEDTRKEYEIIRRSRDGYFNLRKYHFVFPPISFLIDLQEQKMNILSRDERIFRSIQWRETERKTQYERLIPRAKLVQKNAGEFNFEGFQKLPSSMNFGQKDVRKLKIGYKESSFDVFVWRIPFIQINRNIKKSSQLFDHIALALSQLDHPFILKTHSGFKDSHVLKNKLGYIVTEACNSTLEDYIEKNKNTFNIRDDLQMLLNICSAMQYLHTHRIINREIKLEDILLKKGQSGNIIKISSVNLAKQHDAEEDNMISLVYDSQGFAAPEIIRDGFFPFQGEERNPLLHRKVGIYNLGMILYCLIFKLTQREFSSDLICMLEQIDSDEKKCKLYSSYRPSIDEVPYIIFFHIEMLYRHRIRNFFEFFSDLIFPSSPSAERLSGKELTVKLTSYLELEMKVKSERKVHLKVILDEFKRLILAKSALVKIRSRKNMNLSQNRIRAFKAVFKNEWKKYIERLKIRIGNIWKQKKVKLDQIMYELNHCVHDCTPEIIKMLRKRFTHSYKNKSERVMLNYPPELMDLIRECWINDPEIRPNIEKIRRILIKLIEEKNKL